MYVMLDMTLCNVGMYYLSLITKSLRRNCVAIEQAYLENVFSSCIPTVPFDFIPVMGTVGIEKINYSRFPLCVVYPLMETTIIVTSSIVPINRELCNGDSGNTPFSPPSLFCVVICQMITLWLLLGNSWWKNPITHCPNRESKPRPSCSAVAFATARATRQS